jgi:hypothetical protein
LQEPGDAQSALQPLLATQGRDGYGIDYALPMEDQPMLDLDNRSDVKGSHASFWTALLMVLYGNYTAMDYPELKINILDLLLRFSEIHPKNPDKIRFETVVIVPALIKLDIQESPPETKNPTKPLLSEGRWPRRVLSDDPALHVTTEEYMSLWRYEMEDMNVPTNVGYELLHSHFLPNRGHKMRFKLLLFQVLSKNQATRSLVFLLEKRGCPCNNTEIARLHELHRD